MTPQETLDMLLSVSCSSPSSEHEGYNEYCMSVELHCVAVDLKIVAKCTQKTPTYAYEIKSIERVTNA